MYNLGMKTACGRRFIGVVLVFFMGMSFAPPVTVLHSSSFGQEAIAIHHGTDILPAIASALTDHEYRIKRTFRAFETNMRLEGLPSAPGQFDRNSALIWLLCKTETNPFTGFSSIYLHNRPPPSL